MNSPLSPNVAPQPTPDLQPNPHLSDLQPNAHLSDLQIDDHLLGDLAPEAAAHLAACPLCASRVASAAVLLASFQSLTLAWSERHSATLPLPDLSRQRPLWQRHAARNAACITACFALAFGVALTNASHHVAIQTSALQPLPPQAIQPQPIQPQPTQAEQQSSPQIARLQPVSMASSRTRLSHLRRSAQPASAPIETASLTLPPRAQQISADNRMLQAISDEFRIPAEIPSTLGLADVSEPLRQTSDLKSLQD